MLISGQNIGWKKKIDNLFMVQNYLAVLFLEKYIDENKVSKTS